MARLVLVNGAPGSGKSTVVERLAQDNPLALPVDVDTLKHSLGRWQDDATVAGLHARRLALALAAAQLELGGDVLVAQYLARAGFVTELEAVAASHGCAFHELVLDVDVDTLRSRLAERAGVPTRPEHEVNNRLLGPADAQRLVERMGRLVSERRAAIVVDARGSLGETLDRVRAVLDGAA